MKNRFSVLEALFWVLWVVSALVGLAFAGVVIWGIIELVMWVTSL